jgi:hypothetical protein
MEINIGLFNQGVCIEDDEIIDVASRHAILVRWTNRKWVSAAQAQEFERTGSDWNMSMLPNPMFERVFVQGAMEF